MLSKYSPVKRALKSDLLPVIVFGLSLSFLSYLYGAASAYFHWFPYPQISSPLLNLRYQLDHPVLWSYFRYQPAQSVRLLQPEKMMAGNTLLSAFGEKNLHSVRIISPQGDVIHEWLLDWHTLWPEPGHLPKDSAAMHQQYVHGLKLAENGDLIFNFTELGSMRIDSCGDVVWQLPRRGHHSVSPAEGGGYWVPAVIEHQQVLERFPMHKPPFMEFMALKISEQGEIVKEISINQLLMDADLHGLLYLSTLEERSNIVSGDTLHLNDLEEFPLSMQEGVFQHGDVMASLRNINTVIVFDPETLAIRWLSVGSLIHQHDPDFVDGNSISVFDNNLLRDEEFDNSSGQRTQGGNSSILRISARSNRVLERFDGGEGGPFFTDVMGDHQRLSNGNILITESRAGRIFEVTASGKLVWEYYNVVDTEFLGLITNAERLPIKFDKPFFKNALRNCGKPE